MGATSECHRVSSARGCLICIPLIQSYYQRFADFSLASPNAFLNFLCLVFPCACCCGLNLFLGNFSIIDGLIRHYNVLVDDILFDIILFYGIQSSSEKCDCLIYQVIFLN